MKHLGIATVLILGVAELGSGQGSAQMTAQEMDALAPEEQRQFLILEEKRLHAMAQDSVTKGWEAMTIGRCMVVTKVSKRRSEQMVAQTEAVMQWLDEAFPYVGSERYVRAPVVTIFDEHADYSAARDGPPSPWAEIEVLTWNGNWGKVSSAFDIVSQGALRIWFQEKDAELYDAFPSWLQSGLRDLVSDSRIKGRKLAFEEDQSDQIELHTALRRDTLTPLRDLLRATALEFKGDRTAYEQSGVFVEFLLGQKGSRGKRGRELLQTYVDSLKDTLIALEEGEVRAEQAAAASGESEPKLDEEAEQQQALERERRILSETFDRTFRSWSDKDWKKFEKDFRSYLK